MAEILEVVYRDGHLQPLKPVALTEGQTFRGMILTEREAVEKALEGLLITPQALSIDELEPIDEDALMQRLEVALRGQRPIS